MADMEALALAAFGVLLGYFARGMEFRRDRQFTVYSECAAAFLGAAHAGAMLQGLYMQLGETMRRPEHAEQATRLLQAWADTAAQLESAIAKVHLIGSSRVVAAAAEMESFIESNIKKVPPLWPMNPESPTETWGPAAKHGPAQVDSEAVRLVREFGAVAQADMRWLPWGSKSVTSFQGSSR